MSCLCLLFGLFDSLSCCFVWAKNLKIRKNGFESFSATSIRYKTVQEFISELSYLFEKPIRIYKSEKNVSLLTYEVWKCGSSFIKSVLDFESQYKEMWTENFPMATVCKFSGVSEKEKN